MRTLQRCILAANLPHQVPIIEDLKGPGGSQLVLQGVAQEPEPQHDAGLLVLVLLVQLRGLHPQRAKQLLPSQHHSDASQLRTR